MRQARVETTKGVQGKAKIRLIWCKVLNGYRVKIKNKDVGKLVKAKRNNTNTWLVSAGVFKQECDSLPRAYSVLKGALNAKLV